VDGAEGGQEDPGVGVPMGLMVLLALAAGFFLGVTFAVFVIYCVGLYAEW